MGNIAGVIMGDEIEKIIDVKAAKIPLRILKTKEQEHYRTEAHRLFFTHETEILGAVLNSRSNPPYGHEDPIVFLGKLKSYDGIFARFELNNNGLALLNNYEGWLFDVRTDRQQERAFLYRPPTAGGNLSLDTMSRRLPELNAIIGAVQGYESIVKARRFWQPNDL